MDKAAPMLRGACHMIFSGSPQISASRWHGTGYCNGLDGDRDRAEGR